MIPTIETKPHRLVGWAAGQHKYEMVVYCSLFSQGFHKPANYRNAGRAGNGTRTRDINLGKVALYQLSYSRLNTISNIKKTIV
jgi:hypothetical protein